MFVQLFGRYLVEQGVFDYDTLYDLCKDQSNTRVRIGTIAVANGWMTNEQAQEINMLQMEMDLKFGDIAVQKGYLSEKQINELLDKQGCEAMRFIQQLVDKQKIPATKIDQYLTDFQNKYGFSANELKALKDEDIECLIPFYTQGCEPVLADLAGLVMKNIVRFITTDFYPMKIRRVNRYSYTSLIGQRTQGEHTICLGFATKDYDGGLLTLASRFMKAQVNELTDESYDSICEFVNLSLGLLATNLSKQYVSVDLNPPKVYQNQTITGDIYVMPIWVENHMVDMILTMDHEFCFGKMAYDLKIDKCQDVTNNASGKGSVVIVDDSAMIRKVLRNLLEKHGYCVIGEAIDGEEAVFEYKSKHPDVITIDITMPKMDGIQALKEILEYDKEAKVIMITAACQTNHVVEVLKLGAKQFITKPFSEEEVIKNFEAVFMHQ